jgi:hypothetical protein
MAEEVCLQGHLLVLSFRRALAGYTRDDEQGRAIVRQQFTGAAGVAARRLKTALALGDDLDAAATVLELHPAFLPRAYVDASVSLDDRLTLRVGTDSPAHRDGAWPSLLTAADVSPVDAIVREIDPRFRGEVIDGADDELVIEVVMDDQPAPVASDVAVTAFSTGTDFTFRDRGEPVPVAITPRPVL